MDIHRNRRGQSVVAAKKAGKQNRNCEEDASPTRQSTVSQPHSSAPIVRTQSADAANGLLRSARSFEFTSIEIARSGSDAAIQVSLPQSSAPTVRTQSTDAVNGLPRPYGACSCDFTSIEIANPRSGCGNPSEPAAQSSPDRQNSIRRRRQWTASLRSQFRFYFYRNCEPA